MRAPAWFFAVKITKIAFAVAVCCFACPWRSLWPCAALFSHTGPTKTMKIAVPVKERPEVNFVGALRCRVRLEAPPCGSLCLRRAKCLRRPPCLFCLLFHAWFCYAGMILGPRGSTLKHMEDESGAKILLRGKGGSRVCARAVVSYCPRLQPPKRSHRAMWQRSHRAM